MTYATAKPLAHHKAHIYIPYSNSQPKNILLLDKLTYGVPAPRRMLTPGILNKKHFRIVDYLRQSGLTAAERQVTLELLRLFAYYGKVYPKAREFEEMRGCSRRSFWRAVAKLEQFGALDRINRYLDHRQISNAYRLDKLVLCIVRYLAEHGYPALGDFTRKLLLDTNDQFWTLIHRIRLRLRDPIPFTFIA